MTLHINHLRARRRRVVVAVMWILFVAALGVGVATVWDFGRTGGVTERERLSVANGDLERRLAIAETRAAETLVAAEALRREYESLNRRYDEQLLTGPLARLHAMVAARLEADVAPERIAAALRSLDRRVECDGEVEAQDIVVRTRLSRGGLEVASYAGGALTITLSAVGETGKLLERYRPFDPVRVVLAEAGSEPIIREGVLPIALSVLRPPLEHRFTVSPARRGYATVRGEACRASTDTASP